MNEKVDRFVECYMGKDGKRIADWNHHMQLMYGSDGVISSSGTKAKTPFARDGTGSGWSRPSAPFAKDVHAFREFVINLDRCLDPTRDADLLNIRDDLLGDVNQFLYLSTLH